MTYLDLVNKVLVRLREDEVTSVASSDYSAMVGAFVNDAKHIVEEAYDWSALRQTFTITTQDDIFNYALTGGGDNITELRFINDSSIWFMSYQSQTWFDRVYLVTDPEKGSPRYFTYNGTNSNGDIQLDVYPKPDGAYTLRYNGVVRTDEFTSDTDELTVPWRPVVHMAIALLARERGETGGTSAAEYFNIADKLLSDAIAYDSMRHPEENIYRTV